MPSRPPHACPGPGGGGCPVHALVKTTRCPRCERAREATRPTELERGYGPAHRQARQALALTLPAPCGVTTTGLLPWYCGKLINPGDRWDAAHVIDGHPEAGYVVAHGVCNQRAKAHHSW